MAIFVIRDRETGAYLISDQEGPEPYHFRSELTGLTWIYSDPGVARAVVETFPFAADVVELRPFTGQIEAEYLRYVHSSLGHNLLSGAELASECPVVGCRELRARLGL